LSTPTLSEDDERYNFRTDKALSPRNSLFARFSYGRFRGNSPGAFDSSHGDGFSGSDDTQHADAMQSLLHTRGAGIAHTFAFHPNLLNEFRAGISRYDLVANPLDLGFDTSDKLGIAGLQDGGLPAVQISGYTQLGAVGPTPLAIRTTNYQIEDTLSWSTRHHAWKFGFQAIRRDAFGDASEWTNRGTFTFTPDYTSQPGDIYTGNALASLLFGYPAESRRDVQFSNFDLHGWEWSGFVQDEIRPFRRLTVQLGLRYSLFPPVTESKGRLVNFDFDHDDPGLNQFAGVSGVNQYAGLRVNWHNFAPRIGFALDMFGNGRTVLRGGFSKAYDTGAYLWQGSLARNQPFAARQDYFAGSLFLGRTLAQGFPDPRPTALPDQASLNSVGNSIYAVEPKAYTPYADLYGLAVQQRLSNALALEVGGAGSMGVHLYANTDLNQVPFPGPWTPSSRRVLWSAPLLSRIDYFDFAGGSTYYAGYARLSGQLTRDLQIQAAYTFGKSIDDAAAPASDQQSRPYGPQNLSDPGGSRSPSPFDVTQRLVVAASYDLPFRHASAGGIAQAIVSNWRTSAVVTAQTGLPFTPQLAIDGVNNGGFQLPNRVGDGSLSSGQRSYLHWFNTSLDPSDPSHAFEAPALYQYGNGGFDTLRGPGLATIDLALARNFVVTERLRLETRAEAFNLFDRTNFALPNRILGLDSSGVISHTVTPSRQMQLVVRATW